MRPRQRPVAVVDDEARGADVFFDDEDAARLQSLVGPLEEGDGVVYNNGMGFFWKRV